jgi:membrane associated rhomboid family serine protease
MFGSEIERSFGTSSFARFYILAGLSGAVLTLIVKHDQLVPMIGASAAIYGVLIAYWLKFPERQLYVFAIFPVPVKWAIPGMMVIGFFFGGPNVAHWAHLGGALFGLGYMKLDLRFSPMRWYKSLRYRRVQAKLDKNRQKAEDVMRRVDMILDKINEVGIDNLTAEERKFLEDASSELARKDNKR